MHTLAHSEGREGLRRVFQRTRLRAGTHLSREEVDLPHFNVNYETLLPEKIQRSFGRLKTTVGNLGVRRSDPQQIIEHIAAMPTRSQ